VAAADLVDVVALNCTAVALPVAAAAVGVINYYTSLVVGPQIVVAVVVAVVVAPANSESSLAVAVRVAGPTFVVVAGPVLGVEQAPVVELRVLVDASVRGLAICKQSLVLVAAAVD